MEMEQIVRNVSQGAKPNIRILYQQDAMDFLLYPIINEGFRCIEEGVIAQENLIDIMFILGFGWPIATGGPMRYGRSQGIEKLANTMLHWHVLEPKDRVYTVAETLKNIDKNNFVSKM
uniref:3-hydroxyacyl-CoA dehydrogenase C-terminal domain-containing protein n=1 Tax=Caenorhabditis japonica TaxID=281687 RepID=A0A8R1I5M2_CAEJA